MNRKSKNIFIGLIAPTLALPTALTVLSSCGSINYDRLTSLVGLLALEEFVGSEETGQTGKTVDGITSVYRPTFSTKWITEYLENRILDIMGNIQVGKDHYSEVVKERYGFEFGGNDIYFDIPATNKDMPSFILQGHTDMVWDNSKAPEQTHPDPEIVKDTEGRPTIVRTKGNLTSLGADNGMGLGTLLALARVRNQFEHGKIRVLFTTDEEEGISGASQLPAGDPTKGEENWFYDYENNEYFQYLLNIDLEEDLKIATSCGGTQDGQWFKPFTPTRPVGVDEDETCLYEIRISDLAGGHSALGIPLKHVNSIKMGFDILDWCCNQGEATDKLQLYKAYEYVEKQNGSIPDPSCSSIPTTLCIQFFDTKWSETQMDKNQEYINTQWRLPLIGTDDEDVDVILHEVEDAEIPKTACAINHDDTKSIIKVVDEMPYGFVDEEKQGSANLGAIRINCPINDEKPPLNPGEVLIRDMGRSANTEILGENPDTIPDPKNWNGFMGQFYNATLNVFEEPERSGKWTNIGWTPPWLGDSENSLTKSLKEGSKKQGYNLVDYDEPGWFEVAYFDFHSKQNIDMAAIGYKITDVHTPAETLHLYSLEPTIKILLYALQHSEVHHVPYPEIENTRKEEQYE